MDKKIFTSEELDFLHTLLSKRIDSNIFSLVNYSENLKLYKSDSELRSSILSAFYKIPLQPVNKYNNKEKDAIISCVNDYKRELNEELNMTISKEQKEIFNKQLAIIESILIKCNY